MDPLPRYLTTWSSLGSETAPVLPSGSFWYLRVPDTCSSAWCAVIAHFMLQDRPGRHVAGESA